MVMGCQGFFTKQEEQLPEPWELLSLEQKVAQMIMFRLKGDLNDWSFADYKLENVDYQIDIANSDFSSRSNHYLPKIVFQFAK